LDRSEGDGKLRKLGSGARRRAEAAVAEALRYDESLQHYWTRVEDKVAHGCINAAGGSARCHGETEGKRGRIWSALPVLTLVFPPSSP
jgi:hypothetical protein